MQAREKIPVRRSAGERMADAVTRRIRLGEGGGGQARMQGQRCGLNQAQHPILCGRRESRRHNPRGPETSQCRPVVTQHDGRIRPRARRPCQHDILLQFQRHIDDVSIVQQRLPQGELVVEPEAQRDAAIDAGKPEHAADDDAAMGEECVRAGEDDQLRARQCSGVGELGVKRAAEGAEAERAIEHAAEGQHIEADRGQQQAQNPAKAPHLEPEVEEGRSDAREEQRLHGETTGAEQPPGAETRRGLMQVREAERDEPSNHEAGGGVGQAQRPRVPQRRQHRNGAGDMVDPGHQGDKWRRHREAVHPRYSAQHGNRRAEVGRAKRHPGDHDRQ